GLFIAALAGGDTLTELRQSFAAAEAEIEDGVSPRVAPFADLRDLGALLQRAGFALPVTDVDRLTVRYASPLALMHDLRRMGAANALSERSRRPLRRATLARLLEIYGERFADSDGRIRATFDIVWLSGWAPHESQQRPLKPGSARTRLADALGTREVSAGEKAGDGGQGLPGKAAPPWRRRGSPSWCREQRPPRRPRCRCRPRAMHIRSRLRRSRRRRSRVHGLRGLLRCHRCYRLCGPGHDPSGSVAFPFTAASSDARSAAGRPVASGSRAAGWDGPRRASDSPGGSQCPPSAGRHTRASRDGNPDKRDSRKSAVRDMLR